jgi:ribosomal protein S18 acetylase RimI-like enzyme
VAIVYRPINPENYEEVYSFNILCEYSWRDSSETYTPDSDEDRKKKTDSIITKLVEGDQKYYCLAAFDDATMVGVIHLERMTIDKRPACHIQGLWVHPNYRGHGVAKRLKELGEEWGKKMGSEFMDSNVRVENEKMIKLNEQLGYEVARLNFRKRLK